MKNKTKISMDRTFTNALILYIDELYGCFRHEQMTNQARDESIEEVKNAIALLAASGYTGIDKIIEIFKSVDVFIK